MTSLLPRARYEGLHRKLVVAIDLGTTYSGVSYSILDPGQIPEIQGVNRYPGQEHVGGDLKIPTIMWYDQAGSVCAAGAEAVKEGIEFKAAEEQWIKAEWFKVYLRPKQLQAPEELHTIPPLPLGKDLVEVIADFLRYIYQCTKIYICETHASGQLLWDSFGDEIHFVLTHPNGYEGQQQSIMREAAVLAGLVPDSDAAQTHISLVTEGEASLHYCIQSGLGTSSATSDKGIMIVDCGGGTVDFSSYAQNEDSFEEIAPPECLYNGSVFVTKRAQLYFEETLRSSRFIDDVSLITERFDRKTKLAFRSEEEEYWIQFAGVREKDADLNIRAGQLRVLGSDIASFFEPSISDIVYSIDEQTMSAQKEIASVFLVGGFAASDWLFSKVKERLEMLGIEVSRPDNHVSKAVAHGAVSYYLDHRVTTRISKFTFGVPCSIKFDPNKEGHDKRSSTKVMSASGDWLLPDSFDIILPRNTQVAETKEFRRTYTRYSRRRESLLKFKASIVCYRGEEHPVWADDEPDLYVPMCSIEANMEDLIHIVESQKTFNSDGEHITFYKMRFEIALLFGLTEFKAVVVWQEKGQEKRSNAAEIKFSPEDAT